MRSGDDWMTLAEAGRKAGIPGSKLERLVAAGLVTPTRIGPTR